MIRLKSLRKLAVGRYGAGARVYEFRMGGGGWGVLAVSMAGPMVFSESMDRETARSGMQICLTERRGDAYEHERARSAMLLDLLKRSATYWGGSGHHRDDCPGDCEACELSDAINDAVRSADRDVDPVLAAKLKLADAAVEYFSTWHACSDADWLECAGCKVCQASAQIDVARALCGDKHAPGWAKREADRIRKGDERP